MSDDKKEGKSIKVAFIGGTMTGKTSIIRSFMEMGFEEEPSQTVGASFLSKKFTSRGSTFIFEVWDTAGAEKYFTLTKLFIKDANFIVMVYDPFDLSSFTRLNTFNFCLENNIFYPKIRNINLLNFSQGRLCK